MAKRKQKLDFKEKMYGTTLVGARGQIVIPAQARKDLNINPGDRLIVLSKMDKALGLIKAEDLAGLVNSILVDMDKVDFDQAKKMAVKSMSEMLRKLKETK